MPAANNSTTGKFKVEIFKLVNHLKGKMGIRYEKQETGFLPPEAIIEADKIITDLCANSGETITMNVDKLSKLWDKMREMKDSPERQSISKQIFMLSHEIKDIGLMCGYDLVAYFAESLRDYIGRTELNISAEKVIIQAHLDAMNAVNRLGLKDKEDPKAEELKKMVKIAIEKYS